MRLDGSWWHDSIIEENPNSQIDQRINRSPGIVIKKSRYDAFYDTALESILREKGVGQIVICGVMTHLCCETTARSAFMRGFEVFFTIDGTATYNEAFHRAALLNLAHGFATPVLVKEILAALQGNDEH
jgi:isochorismate hydrolase